MRPRSRRRLALAAAPPGSGFCPWSARCSRWPRARRSPPSTRWRAATPTRTVDGWPTARGARQLLDVYRPARAAPRRRLAGGGVLLRRLLEQRRARRLRLRRRGAGLSRLLRWSPTTGSTPRCAIPIPEGQRAGTRLGLSTPNALGGDPQRIFVMGHSAGAYNAAMLALDPRWLTPTGHCRASWPASSAWPGRTTSCRSRTPTPQPVFFHPDYPPGTQPLDTPAGAAAGFLGAPPRQAGGPATQHAGPGHQAASRACR